MLLAVVFLSRKRIHVKSQVDVDPLMTRHHVTKAPSFNIWSALIRNLKSFRNGKEFMILISKICRHHAIFVAYGNLKHLWKGHSVASV